MAGFLFLLMALAIGVVRRFASNRNLS
jgi:hypothetical protein